MAATPPGALLLERAGTEGGSCSTHLQCPAGAPSSPRLPGKGCCALGAPAHRGQTGASSCGCRMCVPTGANKPLVTRIWPSLICHALLNSSLNAAEALKNMLCNTLQCCCRRIRPYSWIWRSPGAANYPKCWENRSMVGRWARSPPPRRSWPGTAPSCHWLGS